MNLGNVILTGLKEIWAHKFRSALTMFGIILGVSSLVAMSALVKGMENGLKEGLAAAGGMEKIRVESEDDLPVYQRHLEDQIKGLSVNDVHALKAGAPLVNTLTPAVDRYGWRRSMRVTRGHRRSRPYLFSGTWPSAMELNQHTLAHGRMFNEIDDENARAVCVIGTGIRDELFGSPRETGEEIIPLGEIIHIAYEPFIIIGMFERYESDKFRRLREQDEKILRENPNAQLKPRRERDHWAFRLKNKTIYIPLNTMLTKFSPTGGASGEADTALTAIHMKVKSVDLLESALQQVRNVLMMTHKGIEDFEFRTDEDWAEEIGTQIKNARVSRSIIASICLVVGGIGIMNIMLASISERIREIGIRKSVGATTEAIFGQILVESAVIAVLGGLLGLAASFALIYAIAAVTPSDNAPVVTAGSMAFAVSCSAAVGLAAGLYPAFKASRYHPIQALKYD